MTHVRALRAEQGSREPGNAGRRGPDDGRWSAHVDLGDLGLADRWADLAIATWNVTLNYGPGWESLLLDAYGVAADAARIEYYRLLGRCY